MSGFGGLSMAVSLCIIVGFIGCAQSVSAFSIAQFGAVATDNSTATAFINSKAIQAAFAAANASSTDKMVLIPAQEEYYVMYSSVSDVHHITLQLEGTLKVSNNITAWPAVSPGSLQCIGIFDSSDITIQGSGTIDGQGYDWWWLVFLKHVDHRPNLVNVQRTTDLNIFDISVRNSPQYHFYLHDVLDVVVRNVSIHVDVIAIQDMARRTNQLFEHELLTFPIPIFPLNTDGIDPAGRNILIEDCYIENFDDAVAVKPMNGGGKYSSCSSNITIRNSKVAWGVGMTIGSVPPDDRVNCVRNVTFDNIEFAHPIKAIYIKTNPGNSGSGIIDDITYSNIHATTPLWYPIWIGPQQQQQPGSAGTGCSFLYPIVDKCPTQPRVPITNVKLQNVTMEGGLTLPGVLLCNETVPCTGFQFDNVQNSGSFLVQKDYVCKNVEGQTSGSSPAPPCF